MRIVLLLVLLCSAPLAHADERRTATDHVFPLETFAEDPAGTFPARWKVRGDEKEARTIYQVSEENGSHFLHAYAHNQGVQIGLEHVFQPTQFPLLRWRWRVTQLPPGADERATKTNDSAAAVYVIFDGRILPRVIKYVWSSTLPVGTRIDSPVYWRAKVIVLQSGLSPKDEWRQETVNFYQDYKDLFGFEPGEAQGIALLSDSDMTGTVAEADYADFVLLSAGAFSGQTSIGVASPLLFAEIAGQQ